MFTCANGLPGRFYLPSSK